MKLRILDDQQDAGRAAASTGAMRIREAIAEKGGASIIVTAGASQSMMLDSLVEQQDIRWDKVTCFHLGEYIDLPILRPGSHRRYLWEQFVRRLPSPLAAFHYVNGEAPDAQAECRRVGSILHYHVIAAAFVGIGQHPQLAFHTPPADLDSHDPYQVVDLEEDGPGQGRRDEWLESGAELPRRAISMSMRQILNSRSIICSAAGAQPLAIRQLVEGPVTNEVPASILQEHEDCTLFLDRMAASRLSMSLLERR